ncbi:MAG: hypothetical protein KAV00_04175 [Phycisphaerae bacterium]|nr:hypothetical protein [Phycisphaerae bacterium]
MDTTKTGNGRKMLVPVAAFVVFGLALVAVVKLAAKQKTLPKTATTQKIAATQQAFPKTARIIFLHHSTGECVWNGGVPKWMKAYNAANRTKYTITERNFPADAPYGWENYPYDYWNIWVRNAGPRPFKNEPTLEMLTRKYEIIIFKHCFPVTSIEADTGRPDVASGTKRIENYKLQYAALKKKMRLFPKTRFIVWTGAVQVKNDMDKATAMRAKAFFDWVRNKWDEKGDNIYLWDFYQLQTDGGLYLKGQYAQAAADSHPNEKFSKTVAPYFCRRIVDVITGLGDATDITGRGRKMPLVTTKPVASAPAATRPATVPIAPEVIKAGMGKDKWLFDNAENAALQKQQWGKAAAYARDGDNHVVRINFADGETEDWGEYGKHKIVRTKPPVRNFDLKPYKYLAFRVKADREMLVVLGLVTRPAPRGRADQSYFAFSAYVRPRPGVWTWFVFDLTKLELAVEGPDFYAKAGKPARPMHLTGMKFCLNQKNEKASFVIDDITFLRRLPKALKPHLQAP